MQARHSYSFSHGEILLDEFFTPCVKADSVGQLANSIEPASENSCVHSWTRVGEKVNAAAAASGGLLVAAAATTRSLPHVN